ncbi:MAG: hypothetical protein WBM14_08090 [Terracidiphilus sp.]
MVIIAAFGISMQAQDATGSNGPKAGYVNDWASHHLVFSNPGTREDAVKSGTLAKWLKVTNSPRYQMQQLQRRHGAHPVTVNPDLASGANTFATSIRNPLAGGKPGRPSGTAVKKDWAVPLGSGTAASVVGTIGTLNSGTLSSTSTLRIDGVTFHASAPVAATRTGTFTGNPTNGQTVTIGGTEVLTASLSTAASGSGTFTSPPPTTSSAITVKNGANTLTLTTNASVASYSLVFSGNSSSTGTITITYSGGTAPNALVMSPGASSGCTSATVGTFVNALSSTTRATNFNTAIGSCHTVYPAIGVTSARANSTDTLVADLPGNFLAVSNGLNNTFGSGLTAGTNGTPTCTNSTTGYFATSTSTTTLAANLAAAINACPAAAGVTATSTTNAVTVTARTWGTAGNGITLTPTGAGFFAWAGGTLTGGTDGTNTGTSFAIDNVLADNAANLASAITTNGGTVGVTASSAGAVVTVTDTTPGTGGNAVTLAEGLSNFTWAGTTLTGGTNGTTSGTGFAYMSDATTYLTAAQVATNIATVVNANFTVGAVITATANSPATGDVTFADKTAGAGGNGAYSVSVASFSAFSGAGSFSGGANATVQPNALPAMFGGTSPDITLASCSDFVVYPTGQAGATGAANIIAYTNLYTGGCIGTVPSAYWAYNTGDGEAVTTSPVLSLDGSEVAFIQSDGASSSLVVVRWEASATDSITSPNPALTLASNITECIAPCMTVTPLSNNDTLSSPYYDYQNDAIYVGDDAGSIEEFTGVFIGSAVAGPTTVALGHTYALASPVYDSNSGCVFVGDTQGYLYKVDSGVAGTLCTGTTLGASVAISTLLGNNSANAGIFDGVLLDSTAGTVYAFVTASASIGTCVANSNCVAEFPTGFVTGASPSHVARLGTGSANHNLYAGIFDNVYYASWNASGNLYEVGGTNTSTAAALVRIPITSGVMGAPVTSISGLTTSSFSRAPWPSPVTEFCNGACTNDGTKTTSGTDYVFFSVYRGAPTGCNNSSGNACILSYNISNPAAVAVSGAGLNVTAPGNSGCWASGGMVIDNSTPTGTMAGASQIYFVNLNGATAGGGADGATPTSTSCTTTGTGPTLNATQASQSAP